MKNVQNFISEFKLVKNKKKHGQWKNIINCVDQIVFKSEDSLFEENKYFTVKTNKRRN